MYIYCITVHVRLQHAYRERETKMNGTTRCAPSFNEQHKRMRSHVILNEDPSFLPPSFLAPFFSSSSSSSSLLSSSPHSFPRQLVASNLCLSLSLSVWFVGSRLGRVITGYPPLTSVTLVVLSPRTTRGRDDAQQHPRREQGGPCCHYSSLLSLSPSLSLFFLP